MRGVDTARATFKAVCQKGLQPQAGQNAPAAQGPVEGVGYKLLIYLIIVDLDPMASNVQPSFTRFAIGVEERRNNWWQGS